MQPLITISSIVFKRTLLTEPCSIVPLSVFAKTIFSESWIILPCIVAEWTVV